ncbi:MAG: hypothetical protein WCF33_03205 [Pseudonocardiaceae bacterium]
MISARTSVRVAALTDPRWIAAFRAVPRHVFTPQLLDPEADDTNHDTAQTHRAWLSRVYQDDSLITAITHEPSLRTDVPTSSSTRPSLMARMLEVLQLRDGMRVLEIGTGYNAGLLTHRLGDSHVTSIEIEPALIDHARRRLRTSTSHHTSSPETAWPVWLTAPRSTGSSPPALSPASPWRGSPNSPPAGPCSSTCAVRSPVKHSAYSLKTSPATTK